MPYPPQGPAAGVGVTIQAYDEELGDVAGLTPTDGYFIVGNGSAFVTESGATVRTSLGLGTTDSPSFTALAVNGVVQGGLDVIAIGENTALQAAQCRGSLCLVSGAYTVTLPAVSGVIEGGCVTIYSTTGNKVIVELDDSDRFVLDGTALTAGNVLDSESAAGDYVTVIKDSSSGWTVIGRAGAWSDGGAT